MPNATQDNAVDRNAFSGQDIDDVIYRDLFDRNRFDCPLRMTRAVAGAIDMSCLIAPRVRSIVADWSASPIAKRTISVLASAQSCSASAPTAAIVISRFISARRTLIERGPPGRPDNRRCCRDDVKDGGRYWSR